MYLFTEPNLKSPNQSGFIPRDLCIKQLLSITHEIYKSFDDGLEVQGILLYISKNLIRYGTRGSCTS